VDVQASPHRIMNGLPVKTDSAGTSTADGQVNPRPTQQQIPQTDKNGGRGKSLPTCLLLRQLEQERKKFLEVKGLINKDLRDPLLLGDLSKVAVLIHIATCNE